MKGTSHAHLMGDSFYNELIFTYDGNGKCARIFIFLRVCSSVGDVHGIPNEKWQWWLHGWRNRQCDLLESTVILYRWQTEVDCRVRLPRVRRYEDIIGTFN